MKFFKVLVGPALCIAVIIVGFLMTSSASTNATKPPQNLNGSWHQNQNDKTTIDMVGQIDGNHIRIVMLTSNGESGAYWDGTFPVDHITNSFTVTSVVNKAALENDLFASQFDSKVFTYKNGDLSYSFTMLGVTRTIHLSRGE